MQETEGDQKKVWGRGGMGIPPLVLDLIAEQQKRSSKAELTVAYADMYVRYDPDASWAHMKTALLCLGEDKAVAKISH